MALSDDCPDGRSQFLTQSRVRKIGQKIGWRDLARRENRKRSNSSLYRFVFSSAIFAELPRPKFLIGDKVSDHWLNEFDKECVEFGKVVGVCWHPRQQEWAYLIDWTSGEGPDFVYPCFDGHLVIGGDLRLASHD
ncbi:hypothetical protein [Microcoleus sp. K5-D4]|uniref:hypothetical protein n=1 Tax=Microcoleus sp. K5-D4 TaxID=2818801 RepID=UPI002FD3A67A